MRTGFAIFILLFASQSISAQEAELVSADLNNLLNVRDFCLSASEDEAYFTIQSPNQNLSQIVCVKNKQWNDPQLLPFCDAYSYLEPFLSADGKRLYFVSDRPKSSAEREKSDFDIWYVERNQVGESWSAPVNLGEPVNSKQDEFYPALADNGNLYFTMASESGMGKDDIYFCQWTGKKYAKPVLLGPNINSEGYEFNAFVSGDENLLIYTKYNAKGGFGSGDLYVSKRNEKGEWPAAENMGNVINSKFMEYCPFYDQRTQTLYFTSKRDNLFPRKFDDSKQFLDYINGENGLSKIYKFTVKL